MDVEFSNKDVVVEVLRNKQVDVQSYVEDCLLGFECILGRVLLKTSCGAWL